MTTREGKKKSKRDASNEQKLINNKRTASNISKVQFSQDNIVIESE